MGKGGDVDDGMRSGLGGMPVGEVHGEVKAAEAMALRGGDFRGARERGKPGSARAWIRSKRLEEGSRRCDVRCALWLGMANYGGV